MGLFKNKSEVYELIIYFLMIIIGGITLLFPKIGLSKPAFYSAIIFFILAFISLLGYFYTKDNRKTYELLFFSLISSFTGAYLLAFHYATLPYALGTGYLSFSLLTIVNRLYHISKLQKENNSLWLLRMISLILVIFISILTIQNLYREISEMQSMIIGYYFITYGFISFIEFLLLIMLNPKNFEKMLQGEFSRDSKLKKISSNDVDIEKIDKIIKR